MPAAAPARPIRMPVRIPAAPAAAPGVCGHSKASSWSSAPARPVAAPGAWCAIRAGFAAGAGTVPREKTLAVQIPAGVEDGTRIRLSGEGEAGGRGAPPGDLYVHIAVRTACDFPARRRQYFLPGAAAHDAGGAGRRDRGAGHRRHGGQGENPGRHADGRPVPACATRVSRCCAAPSAAICISRSRWKRRRT